MYSIVGIYAESDTRRARFVRTPCDKCRVVFVVHLLYNILEYYIIYIVLPITLLRVFFSLPNRKRRRIIIDINTDTNTFIYNVHIIDGVYINLKRFRCV